MRPAAWASSGGYPPPRPLPPCPPAPRRPCRRSRCAPTDKVSISVDHGVVLQCAVMDKHNEDMAPVQQHAQVCACKLSAAHRRRCAAPSCTNTAHDRKRRQQRAVRARSDAPLLDAHAVCGRGGEALVDAQLVGVKVVAVEALRSVLGPRAKVGRVVDCRCTGPVQEVRQVNRPHARAVAPLEQRFIRQPAAATKSLAAHGASRARGAGSVGMCGGGGRHDDARAL